MKVTSKSLIKFINYEFKKLQINEWECFKIERTHFTRDQYEGGAFALRIWTRSIDRHDVTAVSLCFYPMRYLQAAVNSGEMELFLKFDRSLSLSNMELDLKRKHKINN